MSKFHVGDRVRITGNSAFRGDLGTVTAVDLEERFGYRILMEEEEEDGEHLETWFQEVELRPADIFAYEKEHHFAGGLTLGEDPLGMVLTSINGELAHAELNGFQIEHFGGPGQHEPAIPIRYVHAAIEGGLRKAGLID
jgi:hypothetical protein